MGNQNKNNMGKSKKSKSGEKKVKKKTEIVFDESKRRDFLTGFRKRKEERRQKAKVEHETKIKAEIKLAKEKAKEKAEKPKSASHQIVPEIEHLLENTTNHTDVHDLGSHTVSVTHFDLDKKLPQSESEEEEENNPSKSSEDEDEAEVAKETKKVDKKSTF